MTQALMAELFQTTPQNITLHLRAIYEDGELSEAATCKDYLQVRAEGGRQVHRVLRHYNLEAILAVGYRVRSAHGTAFRQWATARLKEYLVKGFVLDDERLKNPPGAGTPDYFDEILERIRDIRSAEKRMYLKVRDIFKLDAFLQFNERDILTDAGRVEKAVADRLALDEYEKFHARRLAAESEADERAFEQTLKQLRPLPPGKKPKKP
jgi:hypothetical protein